MYLMARWTIETLIMLCKDCFVSTRNLSHVWFGSADILFETQRFYQQDAGVSSERIPDFAREVKARIRTCTQVKNYQTIDTCLFYRKLILCSLSSRPIMFMKAKNCETCNPICSLLCLSDMLVLHLNTSMCFTFWLFAWNNSDGERWIPLRHGIDWSEAGKKYPVLQESHKPFEISKILEMWLVACLRNSFRSISHASYDFVIYIFAFVLRDSDPHLQRVLSKSLSSFKNNFPGTSITMTCTSLESEYKCCRTQFEQQLVSTSWEDQSNTKPCNYFLVWRS